MAPTSEERREVAERLRGPFDVCRCEGHTYINGLFLGMQVCARDETGLRKGMRHLADLIDPTCHLVDTITQDWPDGSATYLHELSCGHTCVSFCSSPPSFCPECGARVVEELERSGSDGTD